MRALAPLAICLVLAHAPLAVAAGTDQLANRPSGMGLRLLTEMDSNKDGVVNREEYMAYHSRADVHFAELDKNKDGAISREEWLAEPAGAGRAERFKQLDTNADGRITHEELEARRNGRFDVLDADHDGKLTAQELQASRGSLTRQHSQLAPPR